MFIGGTNFGFMNGSNYYDELTPDVTSYDYDGVLTVAGDITPKYLEFQKVISKYTELPKIDLLPQVTPKAYGEVKVEDRVGLFESLDDLSTPVVNTYPLSMEKLDQNYGYILYKSTLEKEKKLEKLRLFGANDRALVYINEELVSTLYDRELLSDAVIKRELEESSEIALLVENMGRVNFGPYLEKQRKGIDGSVQINGHGHTNWTHYTLPLDNLERLDYSKGFTEGKPTFSKFELVTKELSDTYLDMDGWGKGCVFVNGFNLGRFWEVGPQKHLYLPAPLLKEGKNEIIIFETEGKIKDSIEFKNMPNLG